MAKSIHTASKISTDSIFDFRLSRSGAEASAVLVKPRGMAAKRVAPWARSLGFLQASRSCEGHVRIAAQSDPLFTPQIAMFPAP